MTPVQRSSPDKDDPSTFRRTNRVIPGSSVVEFEDIKSTFRRSSVPPYIAPAYHGLAPINRSKNRYRDIIPYDENRVKIKPTRNTEGSDYINASYITDMFGHEQYIAAQGPSLLTGVAFIRMIWEYKIDVVVCIIDEADEDDAKCSRYWLNNKQEEFVANDFIVELVKEPIEPDPTNNYVVRNLRIVFNNYEHRFVHFHFTKWPDRSCPMDGVEPVLSMLDEIHSIRNSPKAHLSNNPHAESYVAPLLVHCSAGVGRTGTLIAMDCLLNCVQNNSDKCDHLGVVYRLAKDLRRQRVGMIQTLEQYQFLYLAHYQILSMYSGSRRSHKNGLAHEEIPKNAVTRLKQSLLNRGGGFMGMFSQEKSDRRADKSIEARQTDPETKKPTQQQHDQSTLCVVRNHSSGRHADFPDPDSGSEWKPQRHKTKTVMVTPSPNKRSSGHGSLRQTQRPFIQQVQPAEHIYFPSWKASSVGRHAVHIPIHQKKAKTLPPKVIDRNHE